MDSPNAQHEFAVYRLYAELQRWTSADTGRGEVSAQQPVKINERRGYQPDLLWYERYGILACQRPEPDSAYVDIEVKPGDILASPLLEGFELYVSRLFGA